MRNESTCPICDGTASEVRENFEVAIGSRRASVTAARMRCGSCGEIFYTPEQFDDAQRAASNEIRRQENLLTPEKIIEFRQQRGMSQADLERLISAGPKTVVRWENGTVFQNRTADQLLRVLMNVPEAFEYLAVQRGILTAAPDPAPAERVTTRATYAAPKQPGSKPRTSTVISIKSWQPKNRRNVPTDTDAPKFPQEALK